MFSFGKSGEIRANPDVLFAAAIAPPYATARAETRQRGLPQRGGITRAHRKCSPHGAPRTPVDTRHALAAPSTVHL
jgi:hypothetical protein